MHPPFHVVLLQRRVCNPPLTSLTVRLESNGVDYETFTNSLIYEIMAKIKTNNQILLVAFSVLSTLTDIYKYLSSGQYTITKAIVVGIAELIIACNMNTTQDETNDTIIQRGLITMIDWVMVDPNFPADAEQSLFDVVLRAIVISMGAPVIVGGQKEQRSTPPVAPIRAAADYALQHLLSSAGNFPLPNGPHKVSSELCEVDILSEISEDMELAAEFARYFVLDDHTILTVIDFPTTEKSL